MIGKLVGHMMVQRIDCRNVDAARRGVTSNGYGEQTGTHATGKVTNQLGRWTDGGQRWQPQPSQLLLHQPGCVRASVTERLRKRQATRDGDKEGRLDFLAAQDPT